MKYLIILISLSFVRGGVFVPLGNWNLFKPTGNSINGFGDSIGMVSDGTGADVDGATNCNWLTFNGGTWSLTTDYTSKTDSLTEYLVGFWAKFQSSISTQIFLFGDVTSNHYIVSSTTNGILKVSFYSDSSTTDSNNDFIFNVPLSNFYIDVFTYIAFNFVGSAGTATLNIFQPGVTTLSKTSNPSSSVPFAMPRGYLKFGKEITANFRKITVANYATISADYKTITLMDSSGNTQIETTPCAVGTCNDAACDINGWCFSSYKYCTTCTSSSCTSCDAASGRSENIWCQSCKDSTYSIKNAHCCLNANNCETCSSSSTICDSCSLGSFLYDVDSTTTKCISCTESCTKCQSGPGCFMCAESVVEIENACRFDSVGLQMSFDSQNIEIGFAHTLVTALSVNSFTATSVSGDSISTSSWALSGCTAGSKKCLVAAPNIKDSDLPFYLEVEFNEV